MHPNLVRSSRVNPDFQERELAVRAFDLPGNLPMSERCPSRSPARSHTRTAHTIAADGCGDRAPWLRHPAVHQGSVGLNDFTVRKLLRQPAMCLVCLGYDNFFVFGKVM